MSNGVHILDTMTRNCLVKQLGSKKFKIIFTQGLNRQIRRMFETLGYRAQSLNRVRIMSIKLDVPIVKYREFTKEEVLELNGLLKSLQKHLTKRNILDYLRYPYENLENNYITKLNYKSALK